VPLKGLADPIEVYELAGLGLVRSRLGAAAARGLTRFVGRDAELEQLRQALGHAGAGHGQLVAIVGEPGVGKSRLVWEVTHSHRTHGWLVIHASSVSYGKATPYLPVIDLLSDPAHLARRRRPPAPHPRLLDLWPRGRADALPRRRSPAARLAPTADAPHPRLVRLHDGVSAGAGRRRLAAARAHLGARSDREPAPAVWAGGATLTARGDSAPPATTACRGYPRGRGTARWHGHLVHAVVTLVGQP
jgi:hypothetical protein